MNLIVQKKLQEQNNAGKTKVWNAERVAEVYRMVEAGQDPPGGTPFHEGKSEWKAAEIVYEYSDYEMTEIAKCATDAVYFANNYCHAMTDEGVKKIKLRDYQIDVIKAFQANRFNIFLASRQIGKCFFRQTLVEVFNVKTNKEEKIPIYKLFFSNIKTKRRLSLSEQICFFLLKIETYLIYSKDYKNEKAKRNT